MKNIFSIRNVARRRVAVYTLAEKKTIKSFKILCDVLRNDSSCVIRHEAAFLLGALKNTKAIPHLIRAVKNDPSDLVRHEAIEALGDLGTRASTVKTFLKKYQKDPVLFVKETADVALATLKL